MAGKVLKLWPLRRQSFLSQLLIERSYVISELCVELLLQELKKPQSSAESISVLRFSCQKRQTKHSRLLRFWLCYTIDMANYESMFAPTDFLKKNPVKKALCFYHVAVWSPH